MHTFNNSLLCNKFGGINRVSSSFSNGMITASDMQNVELFDTGTDAGIGIRTMKGNKSIVSLPDDETVINIFKTVQNSVEYCILHTETDTVGKLYLYDVVSKQLTLKYNNLSVTGISCATDYAQGWSDLFIFSNGVEVLSIELGKYNNNNELDEVTLMNITDVENNNLSDITAVNTNGVVRREALIRGVVNFDGRLWLFTKNRLIYSSKVNCYDFSTTEYGLTTSAGFIEFPKDIAAITPYLGALAVFHSDSSCLITIDSDYTYTVSKESPGGCAGIGALVFHGNQLFFYDDTKKSVFAFSQIVNGETTLVNNLAKDVQDELAFISQSDLDNIKIVSVINSNYNQIWFIIPSHGSRTTVLIYDYIHSQWIKRVSQKISTITVSSGEILSGGENKIYSEYSGDDFDGEFIESYYTCAPFNLSVDNTMKILFIPPRVTLDMSETNRFMVRYVRDYDYLNKVRHKLIKAKSVKNLFRWDISLWDGIDILKPKGSDSIKRIPISSFKTLEIKFYTVEDNEERQGFSIKNIEFSRIKVKQL